VRIPVVRKNGSDGVVTVQYETKEIDATAHTATAGVDLKRPKDNSHSSTPKLNISSLSEFFLKAKTNKEMKASQSIFPM